MCWLLLVILAAGTTVPAQASRMPLDVSKLVVGSPIVLTEIDIGKLKGDVRRLSWSDDLKALYLQTAEGQPPALLLHHYTITLPGGDLVVLPAEPAWASEYWTFKQDRAAPGIASLMLDVQQGPETVKAGTGPAGVLDRESSPDKVAGAGPTPDNLAKGTHGDQTVHVVRLRLLGEVVGEWVNEPFNAGMKFGWGPTGSGAIVHVDEHGRLVFFDQKKHRHEIAGTKDGVLPAWSMDGTQLAYLQKTGRRKYAVTCMSVTLR